MKVEIELIDSLGVRIDTSTPANLPYPTARIQKGLVLLQDGKELCEEGVGFGVPVVMRGLQAIFPGSVEISALNDDPRRGMQAEYRLNLVEKIVTKGEGTLENPILYHSKNILASVIRTSRPLRGLLTRTSSLMRSIFGWEAVYAPAEFSCRLRLDYLIDPGTGKIKIRLDGGDELQKVSEIILMNEQGGHIFNQYCDALGVALCGDEIGCWDAVHAAQAEFISRERGVAFSVPYVEGAALFRGREVIGRRLAWAGFGYSFSPGLQDFGYEIALRHPG